MAFDLIAIGDAGIDTLVDLHDASTECSLNKDECVLKLRYADKILVEGMVSKTAYNGMNAAVAARRLGLKTALFATVGGDAGGHRILEVLKREKVDRRYVKTADGLRTNSSVVIDFKGERTILVYHENFAYQLPRFKRTRWFYVTTMGHRYLPIYVGVAKIARHTKAKIAFNPGSNQLKAGAKKLKTILEATTVLFLNKEEAELFTNHPEGTNVKKLMVAMRKMGPEIAVITDGPKGSSAFDGENFLRLPIFPAPIVERTGAGDCYGTAFTAALCRGKDIKEAMRWGTFDAAHKMKQVGPQDGLATHTELQRYLSKNPRFQPKSF